jgi:transposase
MRRTDLSRSQFLRYKRRYGQLGPPGLLHGNRGRASSRRIEAATRERIVALLEGTVVLNDCHVRDLLAGEEIGVSADTVRRIRQELGRPPKQRRRPRQHRRRREREAQRGAMVLIDGSPFRWLGSEQPELTLMGAIDDATGEVLSLTFRPHEDLHGYTVVLRQMIERCGVPWTVYGDRAGVLVRNDRYWTVDEELDGRQRPSHFGQMLEELGIRYIAALSPQAKGRIERLWRTLQDRLTAELALAGITEVAAAEAFLPPFIARFNPGFGQPPRQAKAAWRKAPRDLDRILACRYSRIVTLDNVVSIPGVEIPIPPGPHGRSYGRGRVEVRELLDGRVLVLYQGRVIAQQPAPSRGFTLVPRSGGGRAERRPHRDRDQKVVRVTRAPTADKTPEELVLARRASKPATHHAWRKPYDPSLLPGGRSKEGCHNHCGVKVSS